MSSVREWVRQENRFDFFFHQQVYLRLKKHFYNYQVRRHGIISRAKDISKSPWLEVGAGVTPVLPANFNVTYTELSETAVQELKQLYPDKKIVACSASAIPFQAESFDGVVCSEVLEHIDKDEQAIQEMARILKKNGRLLITVPLNPWMYTFEDDYVGHHRRYSRRGLIDLLQKNGLESVQTYKLGGLVDKACLMLAVMSFRIYSKLRGRVKPKSSSKLMRYSVTIFLPFYVLLNWILFGIIWLESQILPYRLCSMILAVAKKK